MKEENNILLRGDKVIEKGSELYEAIENAILDVFNEEIPLNDPYETTELIVESINEELS